MLKALLKKKLAEFRAEHLPVVFVFLFAGSLFPILRVFPDAPLALALSFFPPIFLGGVMGLMCALAAFQGDFAKEANRFLETMPVRRSAVWLSGYLSGLGLLCVAAVSLYWLEVAFFPLGLKSEWGWRGQGSNPLFGYLLPGRFAAVVSGASFLFWSFSVAVFPVAYSGGENVPASGFNGLMVPMAFVTPFAIPIFLSVLGILPSGLALSPVLLTSAVLFSAGSWALFALVPKHITPGKHALVGLGLFAAILAALLGQLYWKHLAWRVLDPSQPFQVEQVYDPHLEGERNLILANVAAYRSGDHVISIDVDHGTYHDLGRGLRFLDVPDNKSGLLCFMHSLYPGYHSYSRSYGHFARMTPDAGEKHSFKIPSDRFVSAERVQWLPDKELFVYSAWVEEAKSPYLHVLDSGGRPLKRFEISSSHFLMGASGFLMNASGRALVIAPLETEDEAPGLSAETQEKPYMLVDLKRGSIQRFGLPGNVVFFSKDLRRVICTRTPIRAGWKYTSHVLVELPSLEERPVLSEDEFPPQEVTSQVDLRVHASLSMASDGPASFLLVNRAFDTALWVKQRVEGEHFRYSIVLIDLDTAERRVIVPESATPKMPVAVTRGTRQTPVILHRFTADQAAFTYAIGPRTYLCEIDSGRSILLADNDIPFDGDEEDAQTTPNNQPPVAAGHSPSDYAPSGRRVLRYANIWEEPSIDSQGRRLQFAAVEVFEDGKPVRLYTGRQPLKGATWLDDRRIVFYEKRAIYVLESAGGSARKVFPPTGNGGSQ